MANEARTLNAQFARKSPAQFARIIGAREIDEIRTVLDALPAELQASIGARLPARKIQAMLDTAQTDVASWISAGRFEDAVTLLSRVGREKRLALVNGIRNEQRKRRLLRSLQYPNHSVGALVQDVNIHILAEARAADVAQEIRALGESDPGALVVTDAADRYVGMLDAWKLLSAAQPDGSIRSYLDAVSAVHPEMPISAVAASPDWHTSTWLPVVDHDQRVLGAVSRERLFAAAGPATESRPRDILFDLLDELVHVAGTLTERVLRPPGSRS
jgi:Mg/Co/Ni transporter MgtE